jgi:spermidine/putrescine transport system permease protein
MARPLNLSRWSRWGFGGLMVVMLLALYLPIITLIAFSFTASRFPFFPIREWSARWYVELWNDPSFFDALFNSLLVSGLASVTATSLGFLGSYALVRGRFPGRTIISGILVLPLGVPLLLLALSLRIYFASVGMTFGLETIFLGHLVYMLPLSVLILRGRFQSYPWALEEAAFDLGAGRGRIIVEILLPWMLPAILGSLLLNFTFSFDEFIIAWFLTNFEQTLPIKIWTDLLMTYDPTVNVIGTFVFLLSISMALLAQLMLRKS